MKRRGRQTQLGASLRAMLGRLDKKSGGGADSATVGAAWLAIVGASVQSHTTGAYMRDGTLIVYVDSPAWATELTAMSERYRMALNEEIGQELVRAIRFSVSRKVAEQHRIVAAAKEAEDFYSQVVSSVASISDPELREIVLRATVKDLEWKRGIAARNSREEPREGL
jgi:predicted nucleic acid-binding Zn ribbon protein